MADENIFAADPSRIKAGAGATDQVAEMTDNVAKKFQAATAYDVQKPPWGNDQYGEGYVQNFIPGHNLARNVLNGLANAVAAAGALTAHVAGSLQNAQTENTDAIHKLPDPHTTIRK